MTTISWTDETWNVTRGCRRVSDGCTNCYAERQANRFKGPGKPYEGLIKLVGGKPRWSGKTHFAADRLADPLRWRTPRRVFVDSMSDLFYEEFTNEQIAAVFGVMAACPQHTFQVLTKRARRMREWFAWVEKEGDKYDAMRFGPSSLLECAWEACSGEVWGDDEPPGILTSLPNAAVFGKMWPLPNVWLGVSVENQDAADERIPELLRTPAAIRFLSCEPLLGPVSLTLRGLPDWDEDWKYNTLTGREWASPRDDDPSKMVSPHLDWVIAGCESGPGARPCDVAWLRSLRDQCAAAGVPYWLKQAEGRSKPSIPGTRHIGAVIDYHDPSDGAVCIGAGSKRKGGGVIELPYLDGVQHAAFPEVRP